MSPRRLDLHRDATRSHLYNCAIIDAIVQSKVEQMQLSQELRNRAILFITSNDIEKSAIISSLEERGAKMKRIAIGLLPRLRVGVLAEYPVCLLSAERGSHGKASVGMLLPDVLQALSPRLVVLSGFCYANPASVNLHDVVVSNRVTSLVDFIAKDGTLALRSQPILSSMIDDEQLSKLVESISHKFHDAISVRGLSSKLVTGTVYSGEIFSEDEGFAKTLFRADETAAGGDMEGQPVAAQCSQRKIPWLFVKSPSDNGGGTRGTQNAQKFSATVAAIASRDLALEFVSASGLSVSKELLTAIGESSPTPTLDLFDDVAIQELRGTKSHAGKIGEFVTKCSLVSPYDDDFRLHLTAVLKEIAENSAKHGKANRVQLRGGRSEIALDSDGAFFNPLAEFPKMKASGGGQRELASFLKTYGPQGKALVDITWHAETSSQSLIFEFKHQFQDLSQSYFCTLLLTPDEIRHYAFEVVPLVDLSNCREVWLDAKSLYMSGSDGMLLSMLCAKIPKTVERISIRGVPSRLWGEYQEHFKFDARVAFV